jgi:hypothetical protein
VATAAALELRRRELWDYFSRVRKSLAKGWRFATLGGEIETVEVLLPWRGGD